MYLAYGLLAVWTSMGWTYVTLILSHCILLYSISLVKMRWLCFATGLCTLATFKCEPFVSWQVSRPLGLLGKPLLWCWSLIMIGLMQAGFVEGDFELRRVLFYGGCGFTIVRCMSFALENCERKDGNYSILELLKYNFYLPFFYFGPVMTFDKFYIQVGCLVKNNPYTQISRYIMLRYDKLISNLNIDFSGFSTHQLRLDGV